MNISPKGLALIKKYEGFKSKPYLCQAGKPTAGYGMTFYPNGKKVTLQDKPLTESEASGLLRELLRQFETDTRVCLLKEVNQNQFDALVCFVYNVGIGNFKSSTLLKKVNKNPNDPTIRQEFLKWINSNGKPLNGLKARRSDEASLYFTV